ncbi:MAG: hypothetical protein AMXMBFR64_00030 [Myxococcales bacterium]
MVRPEDVLPIVHDAARLARTGTLIVFGSGALSLWLSEAPLSRDVDLIVLPPERSHPVEAVMGELSWYHDKHGSYVECSPPETLAAPESWLVRARKLHFSDAPDVEILVPHPHDILLSKVERFDPHDQDYVRRILRELPLSRDELAALAADMPHRSASISDPRRRQSFELHLVVVASWCPS